MAFTSKAGSLIRETITKTAGSNAFTPRHSIYNAVRSMSSSKIFVGGLNYLTDDQSLRQAFTSFGEVTEAKVIVDRESGRSRGFGFVSFTSCEEASAALSGMDGQELQGRTIRVNYATERTGGGGFRSAYGGGGGYGGSGYGDGGYRAGDGGFGGNSGGYSGDGQGDDFRGGRTSEMSRDNYKNEDGDYAGSSGKGF